MTDAELNGHIDTAEECRDWISHHAMDNGDTSGKLFDFVNAVGSVIDALESARRERDAWKERDHHSNVTLKLVLEQRDEAEQARDEYKEQRDCAARERDTARAEAEQLRSELAASEAQWNKEAAWRTTKGDAGK